MKKILSILALAALTACGGGGDSPAAPAGPPPYDYAAHNGTYGCAFDGLAFSIKAKFEESQAILEVTVPTIGTYTVVYNDVIWKFETHPVYTEYLKGGTDVESVITNGVNAFVIVVGPRADLTKYYTGKEIYCAK